MAKLRTRMSKIKEVLCLKFDCYLPNRSISACLNIGGSTVSDVVTRQGESACVAPVGRDDGITTRSVALHRTCQRQP